MPVYRGVVRGNAVALDEPAGLVERTVVEVRPLAQPPAEPDERAREASFLRRLLGMG